MKESLFLDIKAKLEQRDFENLKFILEELYPADITELIDELSIEEVEAIIPAIPLKKMAYAVTEFDYDVKHTILNLVEPEDLRVILDNMYSDDIADFLGTLSIGKTKELLKLMREEDAEQIRNLLGYDEDSAGGIMTTEYIAIKEGKTVGEALDIVREIAREAEMIYYIYVVNQTKQLIGVLSMRELITATPDKKIGDLIQKKVIHVKLDLDQEEVARIISKYDLLAVPVVNHQMQLLGIITVDDIIDVIEEEATEDIYKMAATSEVDFEAGNNSILKAAMKRSPWLIILLFASMLSGSVIDVFSGLLNSVVALALFMPTLAGTGGNAGTQSLAIVVRGLATGDIESKDLFMHLFNEIKVGGLVAVICGSIIALVAFLWQGNYMLGVVVGLAMFCNILTATFVGTTTPFILDYFGIDPAVAAGPFITTVIDASGLFIYFTLARLFLNHLT